MRKVIRRIIVAILAVVCAVMPIACGEVDNGGNAEKYEIDFSAKTGTEVQFIKKIDAHCPVWKLNGNMNATLNPDALYALNALEPLNAEYFRVDMMFGNYGLGSQIASDSSLKGLTDLEYKNVTRLADRLAANEVSPYLILNGIPEYAQKGGYTRKPDYEKYDEVMYNMASYLKAKGVHAAYETWNEPDLADWYDGVYDLMKTSATATAAIKRADENAVVSALGLAFVKNYFTNSETKDGVTMNNFERFLVESDKLAFPDAIAWHYYGSEEGDVEHNDDVDIDFTSYLGLMHDLINQYSDEYEELATLEQHLTEYHPVSTAASKEDTTENIKAMFGSIDPLLKATDVSRAFWPMYISDDFGVIDVSTYRYNPSYNVLWCYDRLPIDRVAVSGLPENVGVYAASDSMRAGVILFNTGDEKVEFTLKSSNLPFEAATTDVYMVSTDHINYNASITAPYQLIHKTGLKDEVKVSIGKNEAVYIEYNDASGKSEISDATDITLLKKEYYYDARAYGMPYADVHSNSLVTHISMADNATGKTAVNLRLTDVGEKLTLSYESWGDITATDSSALGVKVSFRNGAGEYTNSVFYGADGMLDEFVVPFGTKKEAEEKIGFKLSDSGEIVIKLADKAPADWSGEIALSFLMKDAGKGATVKYSISK